MIKTYIRSVFRSMRKKKTDALIKIGGFSLGIASCLLISMYIYDEQSYDKQFPDNDRMYRVVIDYHLNGESEKGVHFPAPFAKALIENFPEIEEAGRINPVELFGAGKNEIRRTDEVKSSYEEGFTYADQSLLNIFQIPMVYGNPRHALDNPMSMVISKRKADKYFPGENPIGKMFIINNDKNKIYTVNGVMENPPSNSHFQYDFLLTMKDVVFYEGEQANWNANNYPTYILVKPGTDIAVLERKFDLITEKYYEPTLRKNGNVYADQIKDIVSYELQAVSDIHLRSAEIGNDGLSHGDIRFIYIFALIAVAILIIASINFINLSTAKSIEKGKETGLRKTIGANRINLISFFLTESVLYSFISFCAGILLAVILLPVFNTLVNKSIIIPWTVWWIVPSLFLASLVIGIVAGLYPAFYLSSFKPAQTIKGRLTNAKKGFNPRSSLVVFQFVASILLIIGTISVHRQLDYILNKKVGFDKEQVLLLHGANTIKEKIATLKQELLRLPEVENVTISGYMPVSGTLRNGNAFWKAGRESLDESVGGQRWNVDADYIKTMGIKLVEGRNFSDNYSSDKQSVIINQTMAKELGLTEPIGKEITNHNKLLTIIGVVEDFHFESFRENIGGLCLTLGNSPEIIAVRINGGEMSGAINSIVKIWDNFLPNQSIRYTFLDNDFARMYSDVKRMGNLFSVFAGLAIIVACLGLFALSLNMVEKRRKEVGVRKVNGAKISEVMVMLNRDFVKWVAIAFAIATPVAWYAIHKWLENFAYRTELNWWIFSLAGVLSLGIALLTVSWQSWKAAKRNPVEALRYE
jgi:putative ABC transport system permease protein